MGAQHTPIPEWRGYAATPDGRIWAIGTNWRGLGVRELTQEVDRDFYRRVRLTVGNGARKRLFVHHLIAETFVGPRPTPNHQIRHLDGDRSNNRADNLAWGTAKENAADRDRHGTTSRGPAHGEAIRASLWKSPHPNHIKAGISHA